MFHPQKFSCRVSFNSLNQGDEFTLKRECSPKMKEGSNQIWIWSQLIVFLLGWKGLMLRAESPYIIPCTQTAIHLIKYFLILAVHYNNIFINFFFTSLFLALGVFRHFLLIDAIHRSKINSDRFRIRFGFSLFHSSRTLPL